MRILITAGPTREYFDAVRFISNASSGRMGYAVANEARSRDHHVVLVSGPVSIDAPDVELVHVTTADQMLDAALRAFQDCDAAVMTAAVSDWRPVCRDEHKTPKQPSPSAVLLEHTPDICATLGRGKGSRILIGFAVQDKDPYARAEEKMRRKACDAMVLNSPQTLGEQSARIEIKAGDEPWTNPISATKQELGGVIVDLIERLVGARRRA